MLMKDNQSVHMLQLSVVQCVYVILAVTFKIGSWSVRVYCTYTIQTGLCEQAEHRRWQMFCLMADTCKDYAR